MNLHKIVNGINNKPNQTGLPVKIVAIDGHGGSGKSTLAEKLAK